MKSINNVLSNKIQFVSLEGFNNECKQELYLTEDMILDHYIQDNNTLSNVNNTLNNNLNNLNNNLNNNLEVISHMNSLKNEILTIKTNESKVNSELNNIKRKFQLHKNCEISFEQKLKLLQCEIKSIRDVSSFDDIRELKSEIHIFKKNEHLLEKELKLIDKELHLLKNEFQNFENLDNQIIKNIDGLSSEISILKKSYLSLEDILKELKSLFQNENYSEIKNDIINIKKNEDLLNLDVQILKNDLDIIKNTDKTVDSQMNELKNEIMALKEWINYYLINPPPFFIFKEPYVNTTSIYIAWDYPKQITLAFTENRAPYIKSLSCSYILNNTCKNKKLGSILTNASGSNFVKDYNSNIIEITGIVLIKPSETILGDDYVINGNIYDVYFPQDNNGLLNSGIKRKAYVFNDDNLLHLDNDTDNILNIHYTNFSGFNETSIKFTGFNLSGSPSAPLNLNYTLRGINFIIISFETSTYGDINNLNVKTLIDHYLINYTSISNYIKYGGLLISKNNIVTKNSGQITINDLYPDTNYSINVQSKNNINDNYSETSNEILVTTKYIEPIITSLSNLSFLFNNSYKGKKVVNDELIDRLIFINNNLRSEIFYVPINEVYNRGNNGVGVLCNLSVNVYNDSHIINGPKVDFSGFPISIPNEIMLNNIKIKPIDVFDSYSHTNEYNQGYYLQATAIVELDTHIFIPNNDKYTISIIRETELSKQISSSYFYYDFISKEPFFENITLIGINNSSFIKPVSGINVIGESIFVSIIIKNIQNLDNYFYNSEQIISYDIDCGTITFKETDLTNITSSIINGKLPQSFNVANPNLKCNIEKYTSVFKIKSTIYNILSKKYSSFSNEINVICDPESVKFVYSSLPQFIQSIGICENNATLGFRVYSGIVESKNLPPLLYNSVTKYSDIPYDHNWNISNSKSSYNAIEELQIANGMFVTKYNSYGYKNYTNYYGNHLIKDIDYSTINVNSYRYATFVWSIPTLSQHSNFSRFFIVLEEMTPSPVIIDYVACIESKSKPILLYYRFEDTRDPRLGGHSLSSNWITANDLVYPLVNDHNFNNPDYYPYIGIISDTTFINGRLKFNLNIPYHINKFNEQFINIYVRIGLPLNTNFAFKYLKTYLDN